MRTILRARLSVRRVVLVLALASAIGQWSDGLTACQSQCTGFPDCNPYVCDPSFHVCRDCDFLLNDCPPNYNCNLDGACYPIGR